MKKIIVAGNWKMNKSYLDAKEFIAKMNQLSELNVETVLCVPSLYVDTLFVNNEKKNIHLGLQNCSGYEDGAYTGEISAKMIASLNLSYCIVGHSERRQYFGETDEAIGKKVEQLYKHKIHPILCVGESLEEREKEETFNVIRRQIIKGLSSVQKYEAKYLRIAYEPIWAIGTGVTATKEQAVEVHSFIFHLLSEIYDKEVASEIPILYGGSCNEKNADELFSQPHIWGGLIGGASLKVETFYKIMKIAETINDSK